MKKWGLAIIFVFILLAPALAQPQTNILLSTENEGLIIEYPNYEHLKVNTSFRFEFHVFNNTDGFIKDNQTVSCVYHLYNGTGYRIFDEDPVINFEADTWYIEVPAQNFTNIGDYLYYFHCNTSDFGGFIAKNFDFDLLLGELGEL